MSKKKFDKVTLSEAFDQMIFAKQGEGKKQGTILEYQNVHRICRLYFDKDPVLSTLVEEDWSAFFHWLRTVYKGGGKKGVAARPEKTLSEKSVKNVHIVLSALYTWAVRHNAAAEHVMSKIPIKMPFPRVIQPYTRDEVEAMLRVIEKTRVYHNKPNVSHTRPTYLRDRAIILLLVDTGIREDELCGATIKDLSLKKFRLHVYGKGRGSEGKERDVYFSKRTYTALWSYLKSIDPPLEDNNPLFLANRSGERTMMSTNCLYKLIRRIGEKAGVSGATVHRFRHTFAINYLRFDGNIYALREGLGHSTLATVTRYLAIAEIDRTRDISIASPVDNWKL